MIIEMIQADIDKGIPHKNATCPIARALQRHLPHYSSIRVWSAEVQIDGMNLEIDARLQGWIEDYDWGDPVTPIHISVNMRQNGFYDGFISRA
jgi:hypothetical protein